MEINWCHRQIDRGCILVILIIKKDVRRTGPAIRAQPYDFLNAVAEDVIPKDRWVKGGQSRCAKWFLMDEVSISTKLQSPSPRDKVL